MKLVDALVTPKFVCLFAPTDREPIQQWELVDAGPPGTLSHAGVHAGRIARGGRPVVEVTFGEGGWVLTGVIPDTIALETAALFVSGWKLDLSACYAQAEQSRADYHARQIGRQS